MYKATVRKPKGFGSFFGETLKGQTPEHDTLQCVHCGGHWIVEPNSGKERGWCYNCNGPHCGSEHCWKCLPFEKLLEQMENREKLFRNIGA